MNNNVRICPNCGSLEIKGEYHSFFGCGCFYSDERGGTPTITEKREGYRFQETLLDKTAFFDGFLGTIVGDASATPNVLGKRIHEKMSKNRGGGCFRVVRFVTGHLRTACHCARVCPATTGLGRERWHSNKTRCEDG